VKGVIKGWTEALQMMKTGAKWKLWIPADLAYGDRARSKLIGPNATLVFDIDLLSIKGKEEGKPLMGSTRPKVIKK
jgi:FKBP-type peptidyl-prolyl cis-trans isomerase FklB